MQHYFQSALAPSTLCTYNSGLQSYLTFCRQSHLLPFPLTELHLEFFITSIARRLAYRTIKVYLCGLQYHSILRGHTLRMSNMPRLYYLLRGIRRTQGSSFTRHPRAPITIIQLHRIITFLQHSSFPLQDQLMLTSAVTLAFFGLLRVSEYTCHSRHQFYSQTTLLFRNVTIAPSRNLVAVRIKCSKTDPFRTGCIIRIGSTGGQLCPVGALLRYSNIHPFPIGPLFIFANGFFLTRSHITNLLRLSLPDVPHINTHSSRIGGATAAASAGIPDSTIQTLGRWSSDAYRRYLRLSDESVQEFCTRMSTVLLFSRFWDTETYASSAS